MHPLDAGFPTAPFTFSCPMHDRSALQLTIGLVLPTLWIGCRNHAPSISQTDGGIAGVTNSVNSMPASSNQLQPNGRNSGMTTDDKSNLVEEDVVKRIEDRGSDQPIRIIFRFHAAIYFLDRNDPHFDKWLAQLQESQTQNVPVRFSFDYRGQKLTSIELQKP